MLVYKDDGVQIVALTTLLIPLCNMFCINKGCMRGLLQEELDWN